MDRKDFNTEAEYQEAVAEYNEWLDALDAQCAARSSLDEFI